MDGTKLSFTKNAPAGRDAAAGGASRRALLGAAVAAPMAALPVVAATGALGGDAELLRVCREFQRLDKRLRK